LLHGAGGSYESTFVDTGWERSIEAAGRSPVRVNLPGHGSPTASKDPGHYADLAGLLLPALPDGQFDAIGFSLGAKLLLELALRIPQRVGRLALGGVGDNVFAPESVGQAVADALEHGPTSTTPAAVLAFLRTWKPDGTHPLALAAVLRRPPNPVFSDDRLARIRAPVLVVNGANDPLMALGRRLAAALAEVETVIVPGAGHFDLPGQPLFKSAAIAFLNRGRGADSVVV
jgi:pimeloyl-ACP methyl ester carboxylesterase